MIEQEFVADKIEFRMAAGEDPRRSHLEDAQNWHVHRRSHFWRPPTDVCETEDAYEVVVEVAGMRGATFSVTFARQILTVHGMRSGKGEMRAYHQMEIAHGEFETRVKLPSSIESQGIEAIYNDGFLRVVLPKAKPKRIAISDSD